MAFFLNSDISQGSVVTQLRCGEIISQCFVANLLVNLSVKEAWKSVNIWQSYGQYCRALFFFTHSVEQHALTAPHQWTTDAHHTTSATFISVYLIFGFCFFMSSFLLYNGSKWKPLYQSSDLSDIKSTVWKLWREHKALPPTKENYLPDWDAVLFTLGLQCQYPPTHTLNHEQIHAKYPSDWQNDF